MSGGSLGAIYGCWFGMVRLCCKSSAVVRFINSKPPNERKDIHSRVELVCDTDNFIANHYFSTRATITEMTGLDCKLLGYCERQRRARIQVAAAYAAYIIDVIQANTK